MIRGVLMGGLATALLGGFVLVDTKSEPSRRHAVGLEERRETEAGLALFRQQIRPLLAETCLTCHNSEDRKGGLDLSRRATALAGGETGPAIVPGKPEESLAFQLVTAAEMPPDFENLLSSQQIAAFREWIELGAPYEGEPVARADDEQENRAQGAAAMCPCMQMMKKQMGGSRGSIGSLPLSEPLTEREARQRAAGYVQSWGNPHLKIGGIQETLVSYEVRVLTRDGSPVNWIIVDKRTGTIKTLY